MRRIGMDFGSAWLRIVERENAVLVTERAVALFDEHNRMRAFGEDARSAFETTRTGVLCRPVQDGRVRFPKEAKALMRAALNAAVRFKPFETVVLVASVPVEAAEEERSALRSVCSLFPGRKTYFMEAPRLAAIGMDLPIEEPFARMIIDIGRDITEIAVIEESRIRYAKRLPIAGAHFDECIARAFLKTAGAVINAEAAKIALGIDTARRGETIPIEGEKKNGARIALSAQTKDIVAALTPPIDAIADALREALVALPKRASADIIGEGAYLTGGSAAMKGLAKRLEKALGIPLHCSPHPSLDGAFGAHKAALVAL